MTAKLGLMALAMACAGIAAPPVGSAASGGDFRIDSALVKTKASPTWPVMDGQTVESLKTAIAFTAPGFAEIAICPGTKVKVVQKNDVISVELLAGSITWRLLKPGALTVVVDGKSEKAGSEAGTRSAPGEKAPQGGCIAPLPANLAKAGMTMKQKVLIGSAIAAGGGAAIGIGIAGGGGGTTPPPVSVRR